MNEAKETETVRLDMKNSAARPLNGRTVMVTRPKGQSAEMTHLLEELGATVTHCPTIEFVEPDDPNPLDAAIEKIESYDWLLFTSANGVRFFLNRLTEKRQGHSLAGSRVFAIGPATAKALANAGVQVDMVAKDSKAEGAFNEIVEHVGGEGRIRGLRFLIPRAKIARDYLPIELGKLGAHIEDVEAYRTVKPNVDGEEIARMFRECRIDAITFTSSSTVSNFAEIVGNDDLSGLLQNTLVACIGPVTAATAREYGIEKIIQPDVYTAAALVEMLAQSIGGDADSKD